MALTETTGECLIVRHAEDVFDLLELIAAFTDVIVLV